jgi:pilus assembly protein Flp/PilA
MKTFVSKFTGDESGATAIEYGLVAALIAVFIISGLTMISGNMNAVLTRLANLFTAAAVD